MKKRNGFTLIELLAIIVILAIIAVITVPIILNIIENANKGAAQDSAYGYKDAVSKYYVSKLAENKDFEIADGTYTVTELKTAGVNVNGKEPGSNSWVTTQKNDVVAACLQFDEYKVEITNGRVGIAQKGECPIPFEGTYIAATGDETYIGILYLDPTNLVNTCNEQLADANRDASGYKAGIYTGCMKWYVYSENSNNTVNAILDHNIFDNLSWADVQGDANAMTNEYGPYTVNEQLERLTNNWKVPNTNTIYTTSRYTVDYTESKARLISAEEIVQIIGKSWNSRTEKYYFDGNSSEEQQVGLGNSRYGWLFDNLSQCGNAGCYEEGVYRTDGIGYGYWTSTLFDYNGAKKARYVGGGYLNVNNAAKIYTSRTGHGIRPVIELPKSMLGIN